MHIKNSRFGKIISCVMAIVMMLSMTAISSSAAEAPAAGTYEVDSSLSLYITAMGGVEFATGIYNGATVVVAEDGTAEMTLSFGKGQVTIYSVTCDTFIDASPTVNSVETDVVPGYYVDGTVQNAEYTLSTDTALDNNSVEVNYVDSMTFPVNDYADTYTLWLYVNSNVMGCQFCDGNGTAGSNTPGQATAYPATLTVDWSSILGDDATDGDTETANPDATSSQSANVEYTVEGSYEVEIPATITVDADTKVGEYTVTAKNFVIADSAYVTVTATESGVLSNGSAELDFTNTLADGQLKVTGDTLAGTVTVTEDATVPGTYAGTVDFTINYYAD